MIKKILFYFCILFKKSIILRNLAFKLNSVELLCREGAQIGSNCRWMSQCYCSEPFLLTIGNNVSVGLGVQLITHEGGVWVLRHMTKNHKLEKFGRVVIGNNVFLGNNAIVFPNVTIGDNVIVGAGSLVIKDIPSGSVVAGQPAKKIKDIDDYINSTISSCISSRGLPPIERRRLIFENLQLSEKL
jgi:acetyltransferase-like isoleucine patch superfamily enzyme